MKSYKERELKRRKIYEEEQKALLPENEKHEGVLRLRKALQHDMKTVCSGVCSIPEGKTILFYGKGAEARRIDLATASPSEIELLSSFCDHATFGRGREDVLDESYRKAGKLDLEHFSATFDLSESRIMDVLRPFILQGDHEQLATVRPELYKLNVYDQGAFFKAHKDTPRADNMVASLVVVYATAHEGGALVLRNDSKEWVYDSGVELSLKDGSSPFKVGYVAFFSDVEHEVLPVTSGYRITLTYNIYLEKLTSLAVSSGSGESDSVIPRGPVTEAQTALSDLLLDSAFLPEGGLIGFGFCHQYPFHYGKSKPENLQFILNILKGNDRATYNLCQGLGLKPFIRVVYSLNNSRYSYSSRKALLMIDRVVQGDRDGAQGAMDGAGKDFISLKLIRRMGGIYIDSGGPDYLSYGQSPKEIRVRWITKMTTFNTTEFAWVTYGNQAELDRGYGSFCLIALIGPFGDRTNPGPLENYLITEPKSESEL